MQIWWAKFCIGINWSTTRCRQTGVDSCDTIQPLWSRLRPSPWFWPSPPREPKEIHKSVGCWLSKQHSQLISNWQPLRNRYDITKHRLLLGSQNVSFCCWVSAFCSALLLAFNLAASSASAWAALWANDKAAAWLSWKSSWKDGLMHWCTSKDDYQYSLIN